MSYALEIKNISKEYKMYDPQKKFDPIKSYIFNIKLFKSKLALNNVSFKVEKGISYGVLGANGSGKSTLLSIINGTLEPTSGSVKRNGKVEMFNIGGGIFGNYTGIENIYYKCAIHGLNKKKVDSMVDDIIEFSELGEYIYQPVSTYSSGMTARLGFSIAINLEPDIMIVDEGLAVGDARFNYKCFERIDELKKKGLTLLYVSHGTGQVRAMCSKACWINDGELIAKGESKTVSDLYEEYMKKNIDIDVAKRIVKASPELYMME